MSTNGRRLLRLFWLGLTLLLAWLYASVWLYAEHFETERPYIYRQFVPVSALLLARFTGLSFNQSVVLVVMLCAVGFALAAHYLYRSFHHEKD